MPLYDYKCSKCGHIFEIQQKITDDPLKFCPECKGGIKRLISAAGIIFKGSGFHVTDYGKSKQPAVSSEQKDKKTKPASVETAAGKPKEPKSSPAAASPPPLK